MASVLVIGAGTMGRGIAGACALAGHDTAVFDADPEAQRAVRGHVESSWGRAIDKGKLTSEAAEQARHRLRAVERLKDGAHVDIAAPPSSQVFDATQFAQQGLSSAAHS